MDTLVSDNNWGTALFLLFIVATLIARHTFLTVLDMCWGEHSKQRTIMDTLFSGTIEVHEPLLPYYYVVTVHGFIN